MSMEDYQNRRITRSEVTNFHSTGRQLYATIVYDLRCDPIEAIQIMAIWIWIERVRLVFPDLTRRILNLPFQWIKKIGDENLFCWACIDNIRLLFYVSVKDFPLTTRLLKKEMPIHFLRNYRELSISEINEVITTVCANSFKDTWDGAIARNSLQCTATSLEPVTIPKMINIQPEDRTLFVTFSRGYPVTEWEVRELIYGLFGECIESFYMQEVTIGDHSLFAKIVLNHISYVHAVLNGGTKAKFTINGKHVWMRKFIPRDQRG